MDNANKTWVSVVVVVILIMLGINPNAQVFGGSSQSVGRAELMVASAIVLARLEEYESVAPEPPTPSRSEPTSTGLRDVELAFTSVVRSTQESPVAPTVVAESSPSGDDSVPPSPGPIPDDVPEPTALPATRRVIVGYTQSCYGNRCYMIPEYATVPVDESGEVILSGDSMYGDDSVMYDAEIMYGLGSYGFGTRRASRLEGRTDVYGDPATGMFQGNGPIRRVMKRVRSRFGGCANCNCGG